MRIIRALMVTAIAAALLVPGVARAQERTVIITGGGWGHGIGMSQYGALGRARNGKSAEQILEHYYSGTSVEARTTGGGIRINLLPGYGSHQGSLSITSSPFGSGSGKIAIKVQGEKSSIVEGNADDFRFEASGTGGMRLSKNSKDVTRDGKSVFGSPSESLIVIFQKFGSALEPSAKSHRYVYGKGRVETYASGACSNGYCLRLVLDLPMQKYLYGLGEVPSSWPKAALEAQAIAGRTYALKRKLRYDPTLRECGCHLYDSTIDQAYIGDSKRTGSGEWWDDWKGAVDDTNEEVITHSGEVVEYALYSSSSGGHTENNENVWGGSPVEYLRGVSDAPDRAGGDNPNYKWKLEMTWSDFSNKLDARFGVGELEEFELVKPYGVSGRVTVVDGSTGGVRIVGSAKTARASGWDVRGALGLKDTLFRVDLGYEVAKRFRSKYHKLDSAPGSATSRAYDVPRGWKQPRGLAQNFSRGRMTYTASIGKVVWQYGRVLAAYDALGRERSPLGMPTSGVWTGEGFMAASYVDGRLVRVDGSGVFSVLGSFEATYKRAGAIGGPLGVPKADRRAASDLGKNGRLQRFENGTIYKSEQGTFAIFGPIEDRYRKLGEGESDCGVPTSDVEQQGDGWIALFDDGSIVVKGSGKLQVDCA
jgi:SpoIID/LytB domain protein